MIKKRVALIILLISCFSSVFSSEKYIKNLRVNYEVNPLGIEETPVFSWEMESMTYNASQTAYRIVVSDNKDNLNKGVYVFDSGKIKSGSSVCIPYQGNELKPCTRYFWRVTVWDENNNSFVSADEAWFETALLDSGWNNALWIGSEKQLCQNIRVRQIFIMTLLLKKEAIMPLSCLATEVKTIMSI